MRTLPTFALFFAALAACAGPVDPPSIAGAQAPDAAARLAAEIDEAKLASERVRFLTLAPKAPIARLDGLVSEVRRPGVGDAYGAAVAAVKAAYKQEGIGSPSDADIEAMAFLVLMQAAQSAQEDLKAIMASVKTINNSREGVRQMLERLERDRAQNQGLSPAASVKPAPDGCIKLGVACATLAGPLDNDVDAELASALVHKAYDSAVGKGVSTKAELDSALDKAKGQLDSMSEMGEMESLRLQMAMDRMSKLMSTLSNLLKKISDTSSGIVQNIK
jgi:uncharacterized spore protein YtfJ